MLKTQSGFEGRENGKEKGIKESKNTHRLFQIALYLQIFYLEKVSVYIHFIYLFYLKFLYLRLNSVMLTAFQ